MSKKIDLQLVMSALSLIQNKEKWNINNLVQKLNIDEKEVDASILKSTIKNPVLPYDPMTNNRDMTLNQVKEAFDGDIHHKGYKSNIIAVSDFPNELRQSTMIGNPVTFISSVQLYNDAGDMVAVGNLSTPLKKSFTSEATIKVKLTY